ncbi:MAG: aquaporin [Acidimicrobiia bacterium]
MDIPIWKKLVAEFIGTFALVFIGIGSIVAAGFAGAEGGAGLVTIALAHGLAIATMVTAVGHVSGGHFNPAVTVGAVVAKAISVGQAAGYIVSQLVGATVAATVIRVAVPTELWQKVKLGTPMLAKEGTVISFGQGVLIEAVLTFFLVWVVAAVAIDPKGAFGKVAGIPIGLVIAMDIMAGGPLTGASMNPARTFGPALAGRYWADHLVYWLGPLLGGVLAAAIYKYGILGISSSLSEERNYRDEDRGQRRSRQSRQRRR